MLQPKHAWFPPPSCRPRCGESQPRSMSGILPKGRWISTNKCSSFPWQHPPTGGIPLLTVVRSSQPSLSRPAEPMPISPT
ncbi:uncharacterized protein CTRU02_200094 [Colletotrichum truncatum]|uniref:Uncharacterized protein n=1 Tax=Colletotrichum truncatum TaxID=5467 RepID=A0ACC3ZDH1_COLTU|nr:uncharacterized protein CTRU02_04970 [Colletotrichum truncatum]KAF6794769.1 hypothetical protein CTRU02_04970 [Colletotrichum truncatum]